MRDIVARLAGRPSVVDVRRSDETSRNSRVVRRLRHPATTEVFRGGNLCYVSGMENLPSSTAARQLELATTSRRRTGDRLHSSLLAYVALGLLWASPIAAMVAGMVWAARIGLAAVAITAVWATLLKRKQGVAMAPIDPRSEASRYGAWLLFSWAACALTGLWAHAVDAPAVVLTVAAVSAVATTILGSLIDRAIVGAAREMAISG